MNTHTQKKLDLTLFIHFFIQPLFIEHQPVLITIFCVGGVNVEQSDIVY